MITSRFTHVAVNGGRLCCCHVCRILKRSLCQLCYRKMVQYQWKLGILSPIHTMIYYINTYVHSGKSQKCPFVMCILHFGASLVAQVVKKLPAMREIRIWPLSQEDLPMERMATHSGILPWRIPQTEEPGRLQSAAAAPKSLQSCPTLCDHIDGSPPGSAVPGILQARTLE